MKVSVILPTYRRPDDLHRCLQGLQRQTRLPDEVLVILHQEDEATRALLQRWTGWPALIVVVSPQKGQVAQLNLGLQHGSGDVFAITDDDTIPQPSWLAHIEQHFLENADLGGVGGLDLVHVGGRVLSGHAKKVGTVLWFGRVLGNHHIGDRFLPRVDILKGANMAYRAAAIHGMRFDKDLRGAGAQICNDMAFSLALGKRGWRLLYDPAVLVHHYPAQRFDADDRAAPTREALQDRSFNFYLSLRRHMRPGLQRQSALAWAWLVGVRDSPGALRTFVSRLRRNTSVRELRTATIQAWKAARNAAFENAAFEQAGVPAEVCEPEQAFAGTSSWMTDHKAPLRLALVANKIQRNDGQGRVNYEIARAALACGMHVTLLAAHCAEDLSSHPNARFIQLGQESRPTQLWRNLAFANSTAKWLKENRDSVDLVQANGFITWEPCDVVAMHFVHSSWLRSKFYPFKASLHPNALYQRIYTVLNGRWERRAVNSARKIIAVSDIVAHDVQTLGVPVDRIQVIVNGVDVDEFRPGPSERHAWDLPTSVPIALFVGDIRSPRKNVATVLRAIQKLPNVHLVVAGAVEGSDAPRLAKQLGIAGRTHFVGKTAKIPSLMRAVDLFVFPSLYEPYGLVVAEALASGLPVIVSENVGSAKSLSGVVEVLAQPEDDQELANRINSIVTAPERRQMGERARTHALGLSWDRTTAAYLSTYRALMDDKPTTRSV